MAKSPRTGQNRGRRTAERRQGPEEPVAPGATPGSADDYSGLAAAAETARYGYPTRAEIARRAYDLFVARGATHGNDIEDWLQAERELRGQ